MTTSKQPTKQTYSQIMMAHLMTDATITIWDSICLHQITCLAQRISQLRASGVSIDDEMVTQNGKQFKRYWIAQPTNTTDSVVTP